MSTIHHPVHHHTGLYLTAAAIVIAGLLAALVAAVFWPSNASNGTPQTNTVGQTTGQSYQGPMFREECFAHRHGQSIELAQAGCATP